MFSRLLHFQTPPSPMATPTQSVVRTPSPSHGGGLVFKYLPLSERMQSPLVVSTTRNMFPSTRVLTSQYLPLSARMQSPLAVYAKTNLFPSTGVLHSRASSTKICALSDENKDDSYSGDGEGDSDWMRKIKEGKYEIKEAREHDELIRAAWLKKKSYDEMRIWPEQKEVSGLGVFYEYQILCGSRLEEGVAKSNHVIIASILDDTSGEPEYIFGSLEFYTESGDNWDSVREDFEKYGIITYVTVNKFYRRQGVASRMMTAVIDWARLGGINFILAKVPSSHPEAVEFFVKCGFQIVHEEPLKRKGFVVVQFIYQTPPL